MRKNKSIQDILEDSFLFQGLPSQLVSSAKSRTEVVFFQKGNPIYTRENYRPAIGFILSGVAVVQKEGQLVLHTLCQGDCFGVAALFHPTDYVSCIIAKTDTYVLFLPDTLLLELFRQDSRVAVNYIAFLSQRIHFLNNKIDSFAAPSAQMSLQAYLRNNLQDSAVSVDSGYSQLARQLNMGRASLYRSLDALEQQGIIRRENRQILVLQPDKL